MRGNPVSAGRERARTGARVRGRYVRGVDGGVIRLAAQYPNRRKECPQCQTYFVARRLDRVYCGPACRNRRNTTGRAERPCETCGAVFEAFPTARFCSRRCVLVSQGRARPEPLGEIQCLVCSARFVPRSSRSRYCSLACKNENYRPTGRERVRRAYRADPDRARQRNRAWRAANREHVREYQRRYREGNERHRAYMYEYRRVWAERHPVVMLAGESVRIDSLPEELRPIALLIRETRRAIKEVQR